MIYILLALALCKTLYWLYVWQLKEYRLDRMRDFLSTHTGRHKVWRNVFSVADIVLLIVSLLLASSLSPLLSILWGIVCGAEVLMYILARSSFKPRFTAKALLVIALTFFITFFIAQMSRVSAFMLFVFTPLLVPFIVTAIILLFNPLSRIARGVVISIAKQRLEQMKEKPIVVGITGSFGKTTTKEYLKTILSEKFRVMITPAHVNVDIGVARAILKLLKDDTQVCIVEMGAYRQGEIAAICRMVKPHIGIITAIADQHLSLFGDVKIIQQTKGELIQALPEDGLCVVNQDFILATEAAKLWSKAPVYTYSTNRPANITVSEVEAKRNAVQARYRGKRLNFSFTAPMHGKHLLSNVLAAITVAEHLGLSQEEIVRGLEKIDTLEGTMQLVTGKTGATVIDDHYNSNPEGFTAALEYLNTFNGQRKIVVTPGMLELGTASAERHHDVGKAIADNADVCIITKKDFAQDIITGIETSARRIEFHVCSSSEEAVGLIEGTSEKDCILLEGRSTTPIINALI
ncbi:MAG: UDP-N-acetylmuramoyl-tripeptide--D-alanyl-D-alanine ligase [Candidatus Kerfeldbacteria bacterium]|nr:UDP-N-acetylmuramoyl-tripeptide--D-alanyl-D-alanine ligase [Candidatus Kerfeldbacteria bacterium]